MSHGDKSKNVKFQHKIKTASYKDHQRSNLEWHYIKKLISPGVLFVWKIQTYIKNITGLVLCRSTILRIIHIIILT